MRRVLLIFLTLALLAGCTENTSNQNPVVFMTTQEFFNGYAAGLLTYSPETISSFYQVPLTVYSDEGIQQVSKMKHVEAFWKAGVKPYKGQGIQKSVPQLVSEDKLSDKIITCKVLWKNYDASGREVAQETNFYILSKTEAGLKISGLIIMTQK